MPVSLRRRHRALHVDILSEASEEWLGGRLADIFDQRVRTAMGGNRVKIPKTSWILVLTVAVLSVLSALYVGLTPTADQTELQGRTWEQFARQDPEVAALYSMDLALLGMSIGAFAVLATVVAAIPYRRGERWAWYALWVVPLMWGGVAVRMFIDQYSAGYVYAIAAAIAVVGLLIPFRRIRTEG